MVEAKAYNVPLSSLANVSDETDLGRDVETILDEKEYRKIHEEHNPYAFLGAILKRLGLPSLKEQRWGQQVFVEVSHPYLLQASGQEIDDKFVTDNRKAILIAGTFKDCVQVAGGQIQRILFIDDVHLPEDLKGTTFMQETKVLGMTIYTDVRQGFSIGSRAHNAPQTLYEQVIFESEFLKAGQALIDQLKADPNIKINGETRLKIKGEEKNGLPDVYLYEKGPDGKDSTQPSCDILDCAYQLSKGKGMIILPKKYQSQQQRVDRVKNIVSPEHSRDVVTLLI